MQQYKGMKMSSKSIPEFILTSAEKRGIKKATTSKSTKKHFSPEQTASLMNYIFGNTTNESYSKLETVKEEVNIKSCDIGETKFCRQCGVEKHISNFYTSSYSKDGYRFHCKSCETIRQKAEAEIRKAEYKRLIEEKALFRCKCCGKEKEVIDFPKDVSYSLCFKKICKECSENSKN